jgi:hypothetical protein
VFGFHFAGRPQWGQVLNGPLTLLDIVSVPDEGDPSAGDDSFDRRPDDAVTGAPAASEVEYKDEYAVAIRLQAVATPSCPCHTVNLGVLDGERHLTVMPVREVLRLLRLGSSDSGEAKGSEAIEARLPQPRPDWDPDYDSDNVTALMRPPATSSETPAEGASVDPLPIAGRVADASEAASETTSRPPHQARRLVAAVHGLCNEAWGFRTTTERVLINTGLVPVGQQVRPPDLSLTRPGWGSGFAPMRNVHNPGYALAEAVWNEQVLEAHPDIADWRVSIRKGFEGIGLGTRESLTAFARQCQAWSRFGADVPVALLEVLQCREHPCQGAVAAIAIP